MSREERRELIECIEEKRGSKVIAYVTSDRPNLSSNISSEVVSILHDHIISINPKDRAKLDLFIYSRGGDSDVPWSIVSMFREYSEEGSFSVLIPYRAHSAATVIALGADEIVMTKKAELGPIDITITRGPYNPREEESSQSLPISVEDVNGYFTLLKKVGCERPNEVMKGFEQLTEKVHPLALGTVCRLLQQTELVALRLLGTRSNPFTDEKNREIVRRLSSEIYSHRHTISRSEAINHLGLEQVVKAEDADIDEELWDLYNEYKALFNLEEPFTPEEYLYVNNLEEYTWTDLKVACIESSNKCHLLQKNFRLRKLPQIPPQLTFNLNIQPPVINLGEIPEGLPANELNQIIERLLAAYLNPNTLSPLIEEAAKKTLSDLIGHLPISNFEHLSYNGGWTQVGE